MIMLQAIGHVMWHHRSVSLQVGRIFCGCYRLTGSFGVLRNVPHTNVSRERFRGRVRPSRGRRGNASLPRGAPASWGALSGAPSTAHAPKVGKRAPTGADRRLAGPGPGPGARAPALATRKSHTPHWPPTPDSLIITIEPGLKAQSAGFFATGIQHNSIIFT